MFFFTKLINLGCEIAVTIYELH